MDPLKMYFLLKMGIFHCYVSLPEGSWICLFGDYFRILPWDSSPLNHMSVLAPSTLGKSKTLENQVIQAMWPFHRPGKELTQCHNLSKRSRKTIQKKIQTKRSWKNSTTCQVWHVAWVRLGGCFFSDGFSLQSSRLQIRPLPDDHDCGCPCLGPTPLRMVISTFSL